MKTPIFFNLYFLSLLSEEGLGHGSCLEIYRLMASWL